MKNIVPLFMGPISLIFQMVLLKITKKRLLMRRIFCVPLRTHSRFLPHIADPAPVNVMLMQRFVFFFFCSGANSENSV